MARQDRDGALAEIRAGAHKLHRQQFWYRVGEHELRAGLDDHDFCLLLIPRVFICKAKSAVKIYTLLGLRGNIPGFIVLPDGKMLGVYVFDILVLEAVAIGVAVEDAAGLRNTRYGAHQQRVFRSGTK